MRKVEIKKKILLSYLIVYLAGIFLVSNFLSKNVKPVYELGFILSAKTAYEIELLISDEYRAKKNDYIQSLYNKYQNSKKDLYLNTYFSKLLLNDYNPHTIAVTSFNVTVNSISNVEQLRKIIQKCDLSKNLKEKVENNLFINDTINFKNFKKTIISSKGKDINSYKFNFMFSEINEKDMRIFINEFKNVLEKEALNYTKKLFLIGNNNQLLKDLIKKEILKIDNNTNVINFEINNLVLRTLSMNLILFLTLILPLTLIIILELLRITIFNKIKIKN